MFVLPTLFSKQKSMSASYEFGTTVDHFGKIQLNEKVYCTQNSLPGCAVHTTTKNVHLSTIQSKIV